MSGNSQIALTPTHILWASTQDDEHRRAIDSGMSHLISITLYIDRHRVSMGIDIRPSVKVRSGGERICSCFRYIDLWNGDRKFE